MHQRDGFEFRLDSKTEECRRPCGKHLTEPGGVVMDTAEHLLSALLEKIPH